MDASRTHQPMQAALAATLRPRSIAVVGASPRSFAGQIVQRNCADHRFGGLIVSVNGKYAEVAGAVIEPFVNCGGRVPFSTLVSSGAEAVTTTGDYLRFFAADPETDAVLVFIEGFVDAPHVLAAAREVAEAGKTVAACFVGRSAKARDGILAHSGKLAPRARVTSAALRQAGVVLADDLDELITIGEILGTGRQVRGPRTARSHNCGVRAAGRQVA